MSKLVTIRTIGVISVHFTDWTGNHSTFCGLDGDDDHKFVDQKLLPTSPGAKVDCQQCIAMFDHLKKFNEDDIRR